MKMSFDNDEIIEIKAIIHTIIKETIKEELEVTHLNSNFLNKKQACEYLGVSNNTLDSWIKKGLPVIRIGKTVRFNKNKLYNWMTNSKLEK